MAAKMGRRSIRKSFDVVVLECRTAIHSVSGVDACEAWKEVEANADWLCREAGIQDISGLDLQDPAETAAADQVPT